MLEIQKRITSAQKIGLFFFTIIPVFFVSMLVFLPSDGHKTRSYMEQIQILGGAVLVLWLGITFCLAALNLAVFLLEKNKTALVITDEGLYNRCNIFTRKRLLKWSNIAYIKLERNKESSVFSIIIIEKHKNSLIPNWLRIVLFPFEMLDQKALTIPCYYLDIERKKLLDILGKYVFVEASQDVRPPSTVPRHYDMNEIRPQKTVIVAYNKIILWTVFLIISGFTTLFLWCISEFYTTNIVVAIIFAICFLLFATMLYYAKQAIIGQKSKKPALTLQKYDIEINNFINEVVVMPWRDVHCIKVMFDVNSFTHILTIVPEDPEKYKQYNATFLEKILSGQPHPGHFNLSVFSLDIKTNDLIALLQAYTIVK